VGWEFGYGFDFMAFFMDTWAAFVLCKLCTIFYEEDLAKEE
jgi:hypothetical protein